MFLKEWKLKDFVCHLTPQFLEHEPRLTNKTSFRYNCAKIAIKSGIFNQNPDW